MSEARAAEIDAFLAAAGWAAAARETLPGDASTRRYVRLRRASGETAMLMDQPQQAETAPCPPDADEATRAALGYNACARLAGADVAAFAAVSDYLVALGLSAPRVRAGDFGKGLLLLEDFGDRLYAAAIAGGRDPAQLYATAIDALTRLHAVGAPRELPVGRGSRPLLAYDALALSTEADLLPEWHGRLLLGGPIGGDALAEYRALWSEALAGLAGARPVLTLRDYHAENLLHLDERDGPAAAGLIDFQDALAGHPAYDLVSLLEDARRDVEPDLARAMLDRYSAVRRADEPAFDREAFEAAAALLAAQRNAKIAGIFARLFLRDGKPRYLAFLPRVWRLLEGDLRHPAMRGLKRWFDRHIPEDARGPAAAARAPR